MLQIFCVHNYRRPIWPLLILIKWAVMTHLILLRDFFFFFFFWKRVFVCQWEQVLRRAEMKKKRKSCWQPQQQQKNPVGMLHGSWLQLVTSWFTVNPARCQDLLRSGGGSKCIFYICSRSKKKNKNLMLLSWQIIWFWSCMAWRKYFQDFCGPTLKKTSLNFVDQTRNLALRWWQTPHCTLGLNTTQCLHCLKRWRWTMAMLINKKKQTINCHCLAVLSLITWPTCWTRCHS